MVEKYQSTVLTDGFDKKSIDEQQSPKFQITICLFCRDKYIDGVFGVVLTLRASLAPSRAPVGHPISRASFRERRRDCDYSIVFHFGTE